MQVLVNGLLEGWARLNTLSSQTRAYLLLESWNDNAIATEIQQRFPVLASSRYAVPDRHFEYREDDAPCLIPLTGAFALSASADLDSTFRARQALVDWFTHASEQATQRLAKQELCALVFSDVEAASIQRHWVQLGDQKPSAGSGSRLFRYQDPRVMQRTWPTLAAWQKVQWLGPVTGWWAIAQPWGPWTARIGSPPAWFALQRSELEEQSLATTTSTHVRLDSAQWRAAHTTPTGNRVWSRYRDEQVPTFDQPDGRTVDRLINDGWRLGLKGVNLEDYVWCTWRTNAIADEPRERPWTSLRGAALLSQILSTLREQPEARFASLYAQAVTR